MSFGYTVADSISHSAVSPRNLSDSTGCWSCIDRRLNCDKTRPVCIWCLRAGRVCEGLDGSNSTAIKSAANTEKAAPELAAEKSPDKDYTQRPVKLVSSYLIFGKVHNDKPLQLLRVKDYKSASRLLFFGMFPSPTNRRPITHLNLEHTRTFLFKLQTEPVERFFGDLNYCAVSFSFTLWPGDYTKVDLYRKAYATFQLYLCRGDLERLPQAIKKEVMQVLTPGWFSAAMTSWALLSSFASLSQNSQDVDWERFFHEPWNKFLFKLSGVLETNGKYESLETITQVQELGLGKILSIPERQEVAPSSNIFFHNSSNPFTCEHLVTTSISHGVAIASGVNGGTTIVIRKDQLGKFQYLVAPSSGLQRRSLCRSSDTSRIDLFLDTNNFKTKWEVAGEDMPQDLREAINEYQLSSQGQFPPKNMVIRRPKRNPISDVTSKLEPSAAPTLVIQEADHILSLDRTLSLVGNLDPLKFASVAFELCHKTSNFSPGFQKMQAKPQSQKQLETTHKQHSSLGFQSVSSEKDSTAVRQIILGEFEHQEKRKRRLADELCVDLDFIDEQFEELLLSRRTSSKRKARHDLGDLTLLLKDISNGKKKSLFEKILSVMDGLMSNTRKELLSGKCRLNWTCICGHRSHDDFQELQDGAIVDFATELFAAGYITRAQISGSTGGLMSDLGTGINNFFVGLQRRTSTLKSAATLPRFSQRASITPVASQCAPIQMCRWLHMCLKKRPYATKLEPLHVCKDENQNDFTDASFFRALNIAYHEQRSLKERTLFRLKKIEFVEFELCPENLVDHIIPDKLPPTTEEYDFVPPPPPRKGPPIGATHMMHLLTQCSAAPRDTSFYFRHIPKRKEQALSFRPGMIEGKTGWGLHFVEGLNSSLAVTVMFSVSLILGILFAVCWSIWRKDVQGAFGVASYVTSVITLAVMTWQMWAV